jgi:hypothetical protein
MPTSTGHETHPHALLGTWTLGARAMSRQGVGQPVQGWPRIEVDDAPLSPIDRRPVEGAELTCSIGR